MEFDKAVENGEMTQELAMYGMFGRYAEMEQEDEIRLRGY